MLLYFLRKWNTWLDYKLYIIRMSCNPRRLHHVARSIGAGLHILPKLHTFWIALFFKACAECVSFFTFCRTFVLKMLDLVLLMVVCPRIVCCYYSEFVKECKYTLYSASNIKLNLWITEKYGFEVNAWDTNPVSKVSGPWPLKQGDKYLNLPFPQFLVLTAGSIQIDVFKGHWNADARLQIWNQWILSL